MPLTEEKYLEIVEEFDVLADEYHLDCLTAPNGGMPAAMQRWDEVLEAFFTKHGTTRGEWLDVLATRITRKQQSS